MKPDRDSFIEYLNKYCDIFEVLKTVNGTVFLGILGYDGGNLEESYIEDGEVRYIDTAGVDNYIKNTYNYFGVKQYPKVSYTEFIKNGESKA